MKKPFAYSLKFALYSLIFACLLLLNTTTSRAQTYSLSIWPPLLEVMIQPGKFVTQAYKLTNSGDDQVIIAKVLPFEPSDSEGNINILPMPSLLSPLIFSFSDKNLSLGQPFLIKSGETKDLILKIYVPRNTTERDYFASLIFETNPEGRIGLSETQTAAKIAGNILLTVSFSGKPLKKGLISQFSSPRIVDSFDAVPFILKVENTGVAFFKPFGAIKIEGVFNQKGTIQILPQNILPQFSRNLQITPWKEKFILGPFKATAEFTLDSSANSEQPGDKITGQITFLALPYKAILALIVVLIILFSFKNLPKKIKNP